MKKELPNDIAEIINHRCSSSKEKERLNDIKESMSDTSEEKKARNALLTERRRAHEEKKDFEGWEL